MCVRSGRFAWRQKVNSNIITEITVMNDKSIFCYDGFNLCHNYVRQENVFIHSK